MDKAADAFRTISEVAEALETPAHVLRFWESRFPQIKPVKRAGGRRYYRPADVALLSGIRTLLHSEGMTIRGVQKVLREQGVRHVAALGGGDVSAFDLDAMSEAEAPLQTVDQGAEPTAEVVRIDSQARRAAKSEPAASLFPGAASQAPQVSPGATSAAPDVAVPQEGERGFLAFSTPRSSRPKVGLAESDPMQQPSLPLALDPIVPDAGKPTATRLPERAGQQDALVDGVAEAIADAVADSVSALVSAAVAAAVSDRLADASTESLAHAPMDLPADPQPDHQAEPAADSLPGDAVAPQTKAEPLVLVQAAADPSAAPETAAPILAEPLAVPQPQPAPDIPAQLAGVATRLRGLTRPVAVSSRPAFDDLHARLGLVHAQMAEALRPRRPATDRDG